MKHAKCISKDTKHPRRPALRNPPSLSLCSSLSSPLFSFMSVCLLTLSASHIYQQLQLSSVTLVSPQTILHHHAPSRSWNSPFSFSTPSHPPFFCPGLHFFSLSVSFFPVTHYLPFHLPISLALTDPVAMSGILPGYRPRTQATCSKMDLKPLLFS